MTRSRSFLTVPLVLLGLSSGLLQGQNPPPSSDHTDDGDLTSLDLASLLTTKVTTASKFAERLSDAPGIISVVSQDELRRFGAITLREILDRVPGLTGTTAYFTDRSLVAVRGDQTGIDGGHILILINGRPTREVMEGGIISDLLESFPVNALESIEVIKGPGSVLYGSNAFSGVVNLITKKGATNGAGITALGGAAGARALSGQASFDRGGLSIFAAAQFHQKPDWSTPYRFRDSSGNDPLASTALVQNINITDDSIGTYLGATYKGWSFMSSFTQWENASFVRGVVGEPRWRRGFADLGYALTPSHNWDMNFNLTYTRTTFFVSAAPDIRRDSNEAILEWTNILRLGAKDELTFGALFNHLQGRETYFGSDPSFVIAQGGWSGGTGYAQLNHQLLNSLKLVGGLQVNKVGNVALNVVPRGGMIWTCSCRASVRQGTLQPGVSSAQHR